MISFGKRLPEATYLHRDGSTCLPCSVQERVERAAALAGMGVDAYDVLKLSHDGCRVSFLSYPGFWTDGFPTLAQSWAVYLPGDGRVSHRDYREHWNPPVLHRKELLLPTNHVAHAEFHALTVAAERAGLFEDAASIGQLLQWRETLRSKGFRVVGHQLEVGSLAGDDGEATVFRHRTALRRTGLSTPMQSLLRHGFLDGGHSVFDYGCGHADDLAILDEMGVRSTGWDPHFRPEVTREVADVVNLGFVLNVIEDLAERREALLGAYGLANRLLVVGVLIGGRTAFERHRLFRDGVLTTRGTFQKYFTQQELHQYLEDTCGRQPVPVGPGLAFVFRTDDDEQAFLEDRQRTIPVARTAPLRPVRLAREPRPARIPKPPRERVPRPKPPNKWEVYQPVVDRFYRACLDLGRMAERDEWSDSGELRALGTAKSVLRHLLGTLGDADLRARRETRMDELLVYLALNLFERRRSTRRLPVRVQRDIRMFWGGHKHASARAQELLFSVGSPDILAGAARRSAQAGVGYLGSEDELYVLPTQLPQLPKELRVFVGCATRLYGDVDDADLVKLHSRTLKLTVHLYDDFDGAPLPVLIERVKVDLRRQDLLFVDYASRDEHQVLYFKSRYLPPGHPGLERQQAFDARLAALRFLDLSGFGPSREVLLESLAAQGWRLTSDGRLIERRLRR